MKVHYLGTRIPYYSNTTSTFQIQICIPQCGDIHPNPGLDTVSHKKHLRCALLNARSLGNKQLALQTKMSVDNIDILSVTETWLRDAIFDGELLDQSLYNVFRKDRNRNGGGVLFACKRNINANRRLDLESATECKQCEIIWVQINLPNNEGKILVGTCYRPPSSNHHFTTELTIYIHQPYPSSNTSF